MAHAIEGGKCRVWEKWPTGQPQAGGSEYLELHGVFSIALRAPGAALPRRLGFLAGRGAYELIAGRCGVSPLRRVAEDTHLWPKTGRTTILPEKEIYGRRDSGFGMD